MPGGPGLTVHKVYLGARFTQELISDQAWLLKKVHLVFNLFLFGKNCCQFAPKFRCRTRLRSLESSSSWESVANCGFSFGGVNNLNQTLELDLSLWKPGSHVGFQKSFMMEGGRMGDMMHWVRTSLFWTLEAEIANLCTRWPMVTMGPMCQMKLTRKQKMLRTLGFPPALFDHCKLR